MAAEETYPDNVRKALALTRNKILDPAIQATLKRVIIALGVNGSGNNDQNIMPDDVNVPIVEPIEEQTLFIHSNNFQDVLLYKVNGVAGPLIMPGQSNTSVAVQEGDVVSFEMNHNNYTVNGVHYGEDGVNYTITITDAQETVVSIDYGNTGA